MKDRRTLAEEGLIAIVALVDAETGELTEKPDFLARGFVHDDTTFEPVAGLIAKALGKAADEGIGDRHQLEQIIGRTVSQWARGAHRRSPIVFADHHRRLTGTPGLCGRRRRSSGVVAVMARR